MFLLVLMSLIQLSASISSSSYSTSASRTRIKCGNGTIQTPKLITISEKVWRNAASKHRERIRSLLEPGLTSRADQINTGKRRRGSKQYVDDWTALDPVNPIYNFLIEYYGLKGAKGPRRLGRWSPDPSLLRLDHDKSTEDGHLNNIGCVEVDDRIYKAAMEASHGLGGILLQNVNLGDLGGTLQLRGSIPVISSNNKNQTDGDNDDDDSEEFYGILYNPAVFYNRHQLIKSRDERQKRLKTMAPFQWYASILRTTLSSEPILHCHGLHEWAMQYHPRGAPPPPSAKYQSSLSLRVSKETINETVERKGISCTHVDALRFFAPAAGPLNHHGAELRRTDQIKLEQKACVHAHMDLLKIALKLQPFLDAALLRDALEVAIEARRLDVEASPYDATTYGAGIVPVETKEGRKLYRDRQRALMEEVEPVRIRLLKAYDDFMYLAFEEDIRGEPITGDGEKSSDNHDREFYVAPERLAKAQPGGLPWRRNLIEY